MRPLKRQQGRVDLGDFTQGQPRLRRNVDKLDELMPKRGDDGHYVVTHPNAEFANPKQSLGLNSGGGGNRTHVRKWSRMTSTCVVCVLTFAMACAHKQARTKASGSLSRQSRRTQLALTSPFK